MATSIASGVSGVGGGGTSSAAGQPSPSASSCILATAGYDNQLRLWRVDNGGCHRTFQHPDSQVNALAILDGGATVAAAGHGRVSFYDTHGRASTPVTVYDGHVGNVTALGMSADESWMYTGGEDETVKIWDIRASPDHQREFTHQSPVTSVVVHPNQAEVISADQDGRIARWDLRANQCTEHLIPKPEVAVRCVDVSPDGTLLCAVNNDGECYIWDLTEDDFRALRKLRAHPSGYALKCRFSPDSKRLATTSSDRTAHVYSVADDFGLTSELKRHSMWVWDCAFSGDSNFLVTVSSDRTGTIWDLGKMDGTAVLDLKGHQRAITSCALKDMAA